MIDYMDILIWISIYEYPYMDIHIWVPWDPWGESMDPLGGPMGPLDRWDLVRDATKHPSIGNLNVICFLGAHSRQGKRFETRASMETHVWAVGRK